MLRRKSEIALVLAITVVDNNQQAAAPELLQRLLDGHEGHNRNLIRVLAVKTPRGLGRRGSSGIALLPDLNSALA